MSNGPWHKTLRAGHSWRVFVDGSGDAPTIQAAIDSAADGDTVSVGPGTYSGLLTIDGKSLTLVGSGGTDQVTLTKPESTTPSILTVGLSTGGTLNVEGIRFYRGVSDTHPGGALSVFGDCDLILRECLFEANSAISTASYPVSPKGGAVFMGSGNSLTVEDCQFIGNTTSPNLPRHSDTVGAAIAATSRHARVIRSIFQANVAGGTECGSAGGALHLLVPDILVEDCEFAGNVANFGGAIYSAGSLILVQCRFIGNRGSSSPPWCFIRSGSVLEHGGEASIEDCVFVDNTVSGNVLTLGGTDNVSMRECTIAFNRTQTGISGGSSAALALNQQAGTAVQLVQNLVAFNTGGGIRHSLTDLGGVSCNIVWGNGRDFEAGTDFRGANDNVGLDPRFCDSISKSTEVAADSPCLPGSAGHPESCGVIGFTISGCDTPSTPQGRLSEPGAGLR